MRKITAILAATAIAAGVTATALPARAATHVTWTQRTCAVADAYMRHPARARLEVLVTDSFHVPARWLGSDIAQLYSDVESGAQAKYIADDQTAIWQDCHNGYGL